MAKLKAPFPYFGGKSSVSSVVWQMLGDVQTYIEPFFGSGAVLLNRPNYKTNMGEIVNDADGLLCNVWRALQFAPDEVAKWCDWPVNHADLQARKMVLVREQSSIIDKLASDDTYFDAKLAGYWIWCASNWIGSGLTRPTQIPHLTSNHGINSQIPHLTSNHGINSKRPRLASNRGVNSQIPHLATNQGVQEPYNEGIYEWFRALSERLRYVKVVCGDWTRVCGGNWQSGDGVCGIFFDPPYSHDIRDKTLYDTETDCAKDVAKWAVERGKSPLYRIVLAGYKEEHDWLLKEGWNSYSWQAQGGYSNQAGIDELNTNKNKYKEVLFYSPHCNNVAMRLL